VHWSIIIATTLDGGREDAETAANGRGDVAIVKSDALRKRDSVSGFFASIESAEISGQRLSRLERHLDQAVSTSVCHPPSGRSGRTLKGDYEQKNESAWKRS
jgi:hypothetical protein